MIKNLRDVSISPYLSLFLSLYIYISISIKPEYMPPKNAYNWVVEFQPITEAIWELVSVTYFYSVDT